jgi:hypothetical protein
MATWFLRNFSFQDKICSDEYFLAYLGSFCSLNDAGCVSGHEYGHLFRILERFICECWFPANLHSDSIFHTPNNEKFPLNSTEGMECKRTIVYYMCINNCTHSIHWFVRMFNHSVRLLFVSFEKLVKTGLEFYHTLAATYNFWSLEKSFILKEKKALFWFRSVPIYGT